MTFDIHTLFWSNTCVKVTCVTFVVFTNTSIAINYFSFFKSLDSEASLLGVESAGNYKPVQDAFWNLHLKTAHSH